MIGLDFEKGNLNRGPDIQKIFWRVRDRELVNNEMYERVDRGNLHWMWILIFVPSSISFFFFHLVKGVPKASHDIPLCFFIEKRGGDFEV